MTSPKATILVWDLPVRLFHWLTVLSFSGAWLTGESERWRLLHVTLGYTLGGLVAFRLLWGFIGTGHARFAGFVRGPAAVHRYVVALLRGQPERHIGHNPAGALAILALLALGALSAATGWAVYEQLGGEWLADAYEILASLMLAVVCVHLLGVVVTSRLHGENLVASMITGRKPGPPEQGIRNAWRSVAALMLVAVLGYWWLQWTSAPVAAGVVDELLGHTADDDVGGDKNRSNTAPREATCRSHNGAISRPPATTWASFAAITGSAVQARVPSCSVPLEDPAVRPSVVSLADFACGGAISHQVR